MHGFSIWFEKKSVTASYFALQYTVMLSIKKTIPFNHYEIARSKDNFVFETKSWVWLDLFDMWFDILRLCFRIFRLFTSAQSDSLRKPKEIKVNIMYWKNQYSFSRACEVFFCVLPTRKKHSIDNNYRTEIVTTYRL